MYSKTSDLKLDAKCYESKLFHVEMKQLRINVPFVKEVVHGSTQECHRRQLQLNVESLYVKFIFTKEGSRSRLL